MKNKETNKASSALAGRIYDVNDYKEKDTMSSGLATTHEQVSDTYMEGESFPDIEDANGKDTKLNPKGVEESQ